MFLMIRYTHISDIPCPSYDLTWESLSSIYVSFLKVQALKEIMI